MNMGAWMYLLMGKKIKKSAKISYSVNRHLYNVHVLYVCCNRPVEKLDVIFCVSLLVSCNEIFLPAIPGSKCITCDAQYALFLLFLSSCFQSLSYSTCILLYMLNLCMLYTYAYVRVQQACVQ